MYVFLIVNECYVFITGYYRVNYDDYTWNLIIIALRGSNRTLIHQYNKAQVF